MTSTILGKTASFEGIGIRQTFKAIGLNLDHRDVIQGPQAAAQPKGIGFSSSPVVIVVQDGDEISRRSGPDLKTHDAIAVEQERNR